MRKNCLFLLSCRRLNQLIRRLFVKMFPWFPGVESLRFERIMLAYRLCRSESDCERLQAVNWVLGQDTLPYRWTPEQEAEQDALVDEILREESENSI